MTCILVNWLAELISVVVWPVGVIVKIIPVGQEAVVKMGQIVIINYQLIGGILQHL